MMWDNAIIANNGIKKNSLSYVYEYLPKMKTTLNHIIESCMEDYALDRDEVILRLNNIQQGKTMLKILDEYNWIITRP